MQQALYHLDIEDSPLMLPASAILVFPGNAPATPPAPADWDDVRPAVVAAVVSADPLAVLLAAGLAVQLPEPAPPAPVQWAHLERLTAGALAGLRFGLHCVGPQHEDALAWEESGEFYQGSAADLIALAGEVLESRDAHGRLFLIEGAIAYLTDAEAALLIGAGAALARCA